MQQILQYKTLLQILFWGALWSLLPVLFAGNIEHFDRFAVRSALVFIGIAIVIIVNLNWLLPRLFFNKKQGLYLVAGLALILLVAYLINADWAPWADLFKRTGDRMGERPRNRSGMIYFRYVGMLMPFFTAFIGSALFATAGYANRKEQEMATLRSEKLEAELKFLKSQINPHFLFNALNNIYTLTVIHSEKAPENLLKLSGMLRYMLYECKADRVPLGKEIEYLQHYIDLHLLKDSRGMNVEVSLDNARPHIQIAPMLLIPFVENAFKHSMVEDLEKGWIKIILLTTDEHLHFNVSNSVPERRFTKDSSGGIGLSNVQRQLELLYPGKHELRIESGTKDFSIYLKLYT
jgi:hypothetical protein